MPRRFFDSLWQFLLFKLVGEPLSNLPALHLVQSAIDGLVVVCFFFLLRFLCLPAYAAILAAALFSFWPNHGETHFWLTSAPQNLLSTLFVVLFAMTSVLLAGERRPLWLWAFDAVAFVCALFTYDQGICVLFVIVALRLGLAFFDRWKDRWNVLAAHLPCFATGACYLWFRMKFHPDTYTMVVSTPLPVLGATISNTVSNTLGRMWLEHVMPLLGRATITDWLLAFAVAAAPTWLALRLALRSSSSSRSEMGWKGLGAILLLALVFYLAGYFPIWFWYSSPRHHYLPSVGLFAGVSACLVWVLNSLRLRSGRALVILLVGGAVFFLAAASRGESHFWENSFTSKRQLFAELKPDLVGQEVLVLEDFPFFLGPAFSITTHDAQYGPQLLYHGSSRLLHPQFHGSIGGTPAPGGLFLFTHALYGGESFQYYPTQDALIARFTSWERGSLKFQKNPARPLPYQVISADRRPKNASFAIQETSARREGDGVIVSLRFQANVPPQTYLTAIFSFNHGGKFLRWGQRDRAGDLNVVPVLLSDPGPNPRSGGCEWVETLRLPSFPQTDRIRMDFFEARKHHPPAYLGGAEVGVEP
ncbi:MAG: hypothetical protein HY236_00065 [Acidobacteria bacterium]|nr:hypothetical protein [Acidobacteriota bacterium]